MHLLCHISQRGDFIYNGQPPWGQLIEKGDDIGERYSDTIDYKQYEGQIQKLIDTHIESGEIEVITSLVNIFDKDKFAEAVERVAGTAAKADTIASRTAKYITENIEKAPDFYKKFSDMLKDTILAYEQGRISDLEYLNKVNSIKE